MGGKILCRGLADKPYAQSEKYAVERHLFRCFDASNDVLGRFLPEPRQDCKLCRLQVIQVGHVPYEAAFEKQLYRLLAQPVDIHGLAANEMYYAAEYLGPAMALVWTVVLCLAFISYQRRAAFWAIGDIFERFAVSRSFGKFNPGDFGDYLTAFLDVYLVPDAYVEQCYLLGIVQGSAFYGRACEQNRFEVGYRRYGSPYDRPGSRRSAVW